MKKLRAFIQAETPGGRIFESIIQGLIIVSLISFSFETIPELSKEQRKWLWLIEISCIVIFTIEYILRVVTAKNPLRFIFSFMGLIDLMAILPFYLAVGFDLRAARALRLMRIFRVFKLVRYNKAFKRFTLALKMVREELLIFFTAAILLIYLTSIGIYYFEHAAQPEVFSSVFNSMWWSIVTLTTVGYGDAYPITAGGKVFTSLILLIGLGVVAVPTGLLSSALTSARELEKEMDSKEEAERKKMFDETYETDENEDE